MAMDGEAAELAVHVEQLRGHNMPVYAREALDHIRSAPGTVDARSCTVGQPVGVRSACVRDGRTVAYVLLCGKRALHLWPVADANQTHGVDGDDDEEEDGTTAMAGAGAGGSYCLALPSTGLGYTQTLVAVFHTVGSEHPCALVVSPEGVARLWPNASRPDHYVERSVDLKGHVAALLRPLQCGSRFILATTSGELYLLQAAIVGRAVPELSCTSASSAGGVLYSVGRRVTSLLFGTAPTGAETGASHAAPGGADGDGDNAAYRLVTVLLLPADRLAVQTVLVVLSRCIQLWRVDEQHGGGGGGALVTLVHTADLTDALLLDALTCHWGIGGEVTMERARSMTALESWIVDCCLWHNALILLIASCEKESRAGNDNKYAFAYLSLDGTMERFECVSAAEFELGSNRNINWQQSKLYAPVSNSNVVLGGGDLQIFCLCSDALAAVRLIEPSKLKESTKRGSRIPFACTVAVHRFAHDDLPLGAGYHDGSMLAFFTDSELCSVQLVPKDLIEGEREALSVTRSVERRSHIGAQNRSAQHEKSAAFDRSVRMRLAAPADHDADEQLYEIFQTAFIRFSTKRLNAACDLVESLRRSLGGEQRVSSTVAQFALRLSATLLNDEPPTGESAPHAGSAIEQVTSVPFMIYDQLVGKRECLRRLHSFAQHTGLLLEMADRLDTLASLNEDFEKVAVALSIHKCIADRMPGAVSLAVSDVLAKRNANARRIFADLYVFFWRVSEIDSFLPRLVEHQSALVRQAPGVEVTDADAGQSGHNADVSRPCDDVAYCAQLLHQCAQSVLAVRNKPLWSAAAERALHSWTLGPHWAQSIRDMLRVCKAAASMGYASPADRTSLGEHASHLCLDALQLQLAEKRPALATDLCLYLEKSGWISASWHVASESGNFDHLAHLCVDMEPDFQGKRRALAMCADKFHSKGFAEVACAWLINNGRPSDLMQLALHDAQEGDQTEPTVATEILRAAAVRAVMADERLSWIFCAKGGAYDKARDDLTTLALSDGTKPYRTVLTLLSLSKLCSLAAPHAADKVGSIDAQLVLVESLDLCPTEALLHAGYAGRDAVPMLDEIGILELYCQTPADVVMDERSAVAALRLLERVAQRIDAPSIGSTGRTQLLDDFARLHASLWLRFASDDNWSSVFVGRDTVAAVQRTHYFRRCAAYCEPDAPAVDPLLTGASRTKVIPDAAGTAARLADSAGDVPRSKLTQMLQFGADVMQSNFATVDESTVYG